MAVPPIVENPDDPNVTDLSDSTSTNASDALSANANPTPPAAGVAIDTDDDAIDNDAADDDNDEAENTCTKCGEATDDGEGENGLCGNCADVASTTRAGAAPDPAPITGGSSADDEPPLSFKIDPQAVAGIIQGLASSIPPRGTTLITIAKLADEQTIRVTVIPARGTKEGESAQPLQVDGTPADIDVHLLEALSVYVPARQIAIEAAEVVAKRTVTAAKAAYTPKPKPATTPGTKAAAGTATTTTVMKKSPSLTVTATPTDATIKVLNLKTSKYIPLESGKKSEIVKGAYSLMVSQIGFKTHIESITIADEAVVKSIILKEDAPSLLTAAGAQ